MYKTEKQMTFRATRDAIEEAYTQHDISIDQGEYDATLGYPFQYPIRWLGDESQKKRIGLRSIDIRPPAMMLGLKLTVKYVIDEEERIFSFRNIFDVTSKNTLKEILNAISVGLVIFYINKDDHSRYLQLIYNYDADNNLVFNVVDENDEKQQFIIESSRGEDSEEIKDFLKFLNQSTTNSELLNSLANYSLYKKFSNVWDRENLYVHASFSTAKRHYLGKRGEMHDKPNKLYPGPTNDTTFYLRFTSNHIKNILPQHTDFTIELSFIVNYSKSNAL